MATLLLRNALLLATFDEANRSYSPGDLLIEGNRIVAVGEKLGASADRVLNLSGMVAIPGLVNGHHHLYQTLTRAVPRVQNAELFDWLVELYEAWREITPEAVYVSALVGLGELLLTGCTTSTDHFYVFPQGKDPKLIDEEIRAAREIGIRFHPTRGSMSRGKSKGGLPPDDLVQAEDEILADCERLIGAYHDPSYGAMTRIALAPCSPFSITTELLRETAKLARAKGVRLHTHVAETFDEQSFCEEMHGMRPLAYLASCDWLGPDVWYAHGIYFNDEEIKLLGETGTGVCHCPASNLRLGSGISPVPKMLAAGVPVGLGVDGSASNDSSDMLGEVRQCMLVHRIVSGVGSMTAEKAFQIATHGTARLLGRNDIGSLEVGKMADVAIYDMNQIAYAGAMHDPLAALVFCGASHIAHTVIVNGEIVVEKGKLTKVKEEEIIVKQNEIARSMVRTASQRRRVDYLERKTWERLKAAESSDKK